MPFSLGVGLKYLLYVSGFLNIDNREGKESPCCVPSIILGVFTHAISLKPYSPQCCKILDPGLLIQIALGQIKALPLGYYVILVQMLNFSEPWVSSKRRKYSLRQIGG